MNNSYETKKSTFFNGKITKKNLEQAKSKWIKSVIELKKREPSLTDEKKKFFNFVHNQYMV